MSVPPSDLATLIARALPKSGSAVLAVSGGLDSMTLLDLAASVHRRRASLTVATYDHASGAHSARAAAFVARKALEYGLPVALGRAPRVERSEAAWRAARWEFLRSVAGSTNGVILTAHTHDDQVETVLMRAMRGAGARGLAGLRAPSAVRRPLLDVRRSELSAYARARGLEWLEDPTNRSPNYFRNRVRLDLLPALTHARPTLESELIEISDRAAAWRREVTALIDSSIDVIVGENSLDVQARDLRGWSRAALEVAWPELVSRAGVTLDRRGTRRVVEFTLAGRVGTRMQLSGGWELTRSRTRFELHRAQPVAGSVNDLRPLVTPMRWDRWTFSAIEESPASDPWKVTLPQSKSLWVRAWQPGDKLTIRRGDQLIARKVKYFLTDAGISGHIRARWPVILAGNEIIWIPGVRRADAASARPGLETGEPVVTYACDYLNR